MTIAGGTDGTVTAGYIDGTNEGSDITFTITRTNTNNLPASIFVDTSDATAKDTDYTQKDKFEISSAVQLSTEQKVREYLQPYIDEYKPKNLCL